MLRKPARIHLLSLLITLIIAPFFLTSAPVTAFLPVEQTNPLSTITWGPAVNMSNYAGYQDGSNEPAAAMHPTNPLLALSGGNYADNPHTTRIESTSNAGTSWSRVQAPGCTSKGDGVPTWLADIPSFVPAALFASLCSTPAGGTVTLDKSTDGGSVWVELLGNNLNVPNFNNDRDYLWTDQNPSSPYYGRTYFTETLSDVPGEPNNYHTIILRWNAATDRGVNWSTPIALVNSIEFRDPNPANRNYNTHASLATQPDGGIVVAWRRGKCCI